MAYIVHEKFRLNPDFFYSKLIQHGDYIYYRIGSQYFQMDNITGEEIVYAGVELDGYRNGPALEAEFNNEVSDCIFLNDDLIVAEPTAIRKITPGPRSTSIVTTITGNNGDGGRRDGTLAVATFLYPQLVGAIDNVIYVLHNYHDDIYRIRKIDLAADLVSTISIRDNTGADTNTLVLQDYFAMNGTDIYASNTIFQVIYKLTYNEATNEYDMTIFAGQLNVRGTTNGVGVAALFSAPKGLAILDNVLYVADSDNDQLRKIDLRTQMVTNFTPAAAPAGIAGMKGVTPYYARIASAVPPASARVAAVGIAPPPPPPMVVPQVLLNIGAPRNVTAAVLRRFDGNVAAAGEYIRRKWDGVKNAPSSEAVELILSSGAPRNALEAPLRNLYGPAPPPEALLSIAAPPAPSAEAIESLRSIGVPRNAAIAALKRFGGNVEAAAEYLTMPVAPVATNVFAFNKPSYITTNGNGNSLFVTDMSNIYMGTRLLEIYQPAAGRRPAASAWVAARGGKRTRKRSHKQRKTRRK